MIKNLLSSVFAFFFSTFFTCFAQVTFTHTTNADFNKGIGENVLIQNDAVNLPFKQGSINDWASSTNLPANLTGHRTVVWRNFVFLSGGYNGTQYQNTVYRATINASGISGWTQMTSLPETVGYHAMIATSTRLYVLGGKNGDLPQNKIYSAPINDDGSIGQWQLSAVTLPQPIWGHTGILVNGFIYIAGGTNQAGLLTASDKVYCARIDAEDNILSFETANSLPEARNGHSMTKYDGKLYVLGGYDNAGVKKNTVYYTTLNTGGVCGPWLAATPLPIEISNHVSTCSNGIITVIGGEESSILSNKFYYADIDAAPSLNWILSERYLYDRTKNASAFAGDNQIIFSGGTGLSGAPVSALRYVALNPSTIKVKKGIYVSSPFFVGEAKNIEKLTYSLSIQSGDSYEIFYRVAAHDKVWGYWASAGSTNPAMINQNKCYVQYMFRFNGNSVNDIVLSDLTMTVSGYTQLCGNLDALSTLTTAGSPYWATCNVSFNSGTHIIQPGVTICFSPNTGLEIGQASVISNGTAGQPVLFTYYDTPAGLWNGVYFKDASDAGGVTSQLNYTIIEKAGYGANNTNLWCNATTQPTLNNCTIRNAEGNGIRLDNSNISLNSTLINNNTENGLYLNISNPVVNTLTSKSNGNAGIYYASANLNPDFINSKSESNIYGIYSPTPDNSFAPASPSALQLISNGADLALSGGYVTANRTWSYFPGGYAILGNITVRAGGGNPKLIIAPGNTIKTLAGFGLYIGEASTSGGQLYAVGKPDSLITFTAYNNAVGGWTGLYFNDGSDYNSTSSLRYCIIEKGNDYNIFSVNTTEPKIMFSIIRNSVTHGIKLQSASISIEETLIKTTQYGIHLNASSPSLVLTTLDSISGYCVYQSNATSLPNFFQCTLKNSKYGIYYSHPNYSFTPNPNVTFLNLFASIAMNGGNISTSQAWNNLPYGYAVLDNVTVYGPANGAKARLTIDPGCTVRFAETKGLQFSSGSNYYGELYAAGTSENQIKFTSINGLNGGWNGILFDNASDENGSVSVMTYCTVEKGNSYNIYFNSTIQPTLSNCSFINSAGKGMHFESSPATFSNCSISGNGGVGIYANNSLLSISNLTIQNNGGYAIYYNNAYYVYSLNNLQVAGNNPNAVAINGGQVSENRTWPFIASCPYIILNNLLVSKPNAKCRLTIKPGCTLKFVKNTQIQIAYYVGSNTQGGELYAQGKQDSIITFTALNDSVGGWNGIYFNDLSDWQAGSSSVLKYCTIEKGNTYNIWCSSTSQPLIDSCIVKNAVNMGLHLESSPLSISNSDVTNNGGIGINSINSLLTLSKLNILNNGGYPLYYNNAYYAHNLNNLQITGNNPNVVAINGGQVSENRTWPFIASSPYIILSNLLVSKPNDKCRLTIKPGCTLKFAKNAQIQIAYYVGSNAQGGELYAQGKQDSIITFTALNDSVGGWNGIYFNDLSDWQAGYSSILKYCTIEKGNTYNIWCNSTSQPLIDSCTIKKAVNMGLHLESSPLSISNSDVTNNGGIGINSINSLLTLSKLNILNNGGYPLYYNNAYYANNLNNLQIAGNSPNAVVINGGQVSENRTWPFIASSPYIILNNLLISKPNDKCRLTIKPGCTLKLAKNAQIQIAYHVGSNAQGGELYAQGKQDSIITFTALNDSVAGWNGIYFNDLSDWQPGSSSLLNYCKIEKGKDFNIWSNNTSQPTFDFCRIDLSSGQGIWLDAASCVIKNSTITNNAGYGIHLTAGANPTIGNNLVTSCNIYNNGGGYNLYNNTSNNIVMKYNYWGGCDSTYIQTKIWDKAGNSTLGRITFMPASCLPTQLDENFAFDGRLYYDNKSFMPFNNASIEIKDQNNNTLASTETDSQGEFEFNSLDINVPNRLVITPSDDFGGVNATDALKIMRHFTQLEILNQPYAFISDINKSLTINGTDALLVLRRTAGLINSFPTGDLHVYSDEASVNNSNISYNLSALWFGDANHSFNPSAKSSGITLVYDGDVFPSSWENFVLPVKIMNSLGIGAISLSVKYPDEFLEVLGVQLAATGEDMLFTAENGEIRFGWFNLNPLVTVEGDILLNLNLKTKDLSNHTDPIYLELGEGCEISDETATVINDVFLSAPIINTTLTNTGFIGSAGENLSLSIHPNPATDHVFFSYTLSGDSEVDIVISDFSGLKKRHVFSGRQIHGQQQIEINISELPAGIYFCTLTAGSNDQRVQLIRKLIVY